MQNILKAVLLCLFAVTLINSEHNVVLPFADVISNLKTLVTQSLAAQTFTDPGYLINNLNGQVIYKVANHVTAKLQSGEIFFRNPLNHGGRQAASWYWENKHALSLPEPKDVTYITSIDNCFMCTGSLLASGINVGTFVVFEGSTTNAAGTGLFPEFTDLTNIHTLLTTTLGYYKIEGDAKRATYTGGASVHYKDQTIPAADAQFFKDSFQATLGIVGGIEVDSYILPQNLLDLQNLDHKTSPTVQKLKELDQNSLSIRIPIGPLKQGKVPAALKTLLENLATSNSAENAVAMIDPFGNILLTQTDTFNESPLDSAMFNIVNKYYNMKFRLITEASAKTTHGYKYSQAYKHLAAPRDCQFVFLNAPGGQDPISLNILGSYFFVTNMNNVGFPKLVYINDPIRGTIAETNKLIGALSFVFQLTIKASNLIKASIV